MLFDLFSKVFFNFCHVGGFQSERLSNFFYFLYCGSEILDLFGPLIDVYLILIDICFDDANIINYFLRLDRHKGDLLDEFSLLFHVHLF